jgi:hypothetical protein
MFWAIVQPSERKRSKQQEEEDFQLKLERMRQEAEIKRLKAETNAQIREAQLKGLAATVRTARAQVTGGKTDTIITEERIVDGSLSGTQGQLSEATPPAQLPGPTTPLSDSSESAPESTSPAMTSSDSVDPVPTESTSVDPIYLVLRPAPTGKDLTILVAQIWQAQRDRGVTPTLETIAVDIKEAGYQVPDRITIGRSLREVANQQNTRRTDTSSPRPGTPAFKSAVRREIRRMEAELETPTISHIAARLNESEANVTPTFNAIMAERQQLA